MRKKDEAFNAGSSVWNILGKSPGEPRDPIMIKLKTDLIDFERQLKMLLEIGLFHFFYLSDSWSHKLLQHNE